MFFPCVSIYSTWNIIRDSTVCRDCDGEKNPNEIACWNEKEEEGMSRCVGFMTAAGLRQSGFSLLCAVVCVLSGGHPVSVRMRAPRKTKNWKGKMKKSCPRGHIILCPPFVCIGTTPFTSRVYSTCAFNLKRTRGELTRFRSISFPSSSCPFSTGFPPFFLFTGSRDFILYFNNFWTKIPFSSENPTKCQKGRN